MEHLEYLRKTVELSKRVEGNDWDGFRSWQGVYLELAKMECNKAGTGNCYALDYEIMDKGLDRINNRLDCADFILPAFIRILYEFGSGDYIEESYLRKITDTLLGFKYWLDEPGGIKACYFTENHQILFHSAEYLVGKLFPDRIFTNNGKTGLWHKEHAMPFIRRWLNWRCRFGFSEWLCQGYYADDLLALSGLMYYAQEEDIKNLSGLIMNQLLFDLAANSFQGHLGGTHARAYTRPLTDPAYEGVSPVMALMWDEGRVEDLSTCAVLLASYRYQCPKAVLAAAQQTEDEWINKQRVSLNVEDVAKYGIDESDFDNIMFFWGMQTYSDRSVIENSLKVFPSYNWMNNRLLAYKERYELLDKAGISAPSTPDFTAMTQADIYTFRTRDYMIGCVQDYRRGRRGFQQHVWTASLGGRAIVFTNAPGSFEYNCRPNQFAGNLFLPRAVINRNVVISIYRIDADFIDFQYTHAYFPQSEFDQVKEKDGWVFGRRKDAYIALKSMLPAVWEPVKEEFFRFVDPKNHEERFRESKPFEYSAQGHANVWVCEMGSKRENGSFDEFIGSFERARLEGDTFSCVYQSPSQGKMEFGWLSPFKINGEEIEIHQYKRYDNPACQSEFDSGKIEIRRNGNYALLDFEKGACICR